MAFSDVIRGYLVLSGVVSLIISMFFTLYFWTEDFPQVLTMMFGLVDKPMDLEVRYKTLNYISNVVGSVGFDEAYFYAAAFPYWTKITGLIIGFSWIYSGFSVGVIISTSLSGLRRRDYTTNCIIPYLVCNVIIEVCLLTTLAFLFSRLAHLSKDVRDRGSTYRRLVIILIVSSLQVICCIWACFIQLLGSKNKSAKLTEDDRSNVDVV